METENDPHIQSLAKFALKVNNDGSLSKLVDELEIKPISYSMYYKLNGDA